MESKTREMKETIERRLNAANALYEEGDMDAYKTCILQAQGMIEMLSIMTGKTYIAKRTGLVEE